MSDIEQLSAHPKSWNENELFERILVRYLHVLEDMGGKIPTYSVTSFEDEDIHEVIETINIHMSKHGRQLRLTPGDPWVIQIIREPVNQWPRASFPFVMYSLALLTTLYAGEKWISSGTPEGGWFVDNTTIDALIGYTVPIFSSLIIASFAQKFVAAKYGVNVPHLVPLPGPVFIWWPFGLFGFASLPRSDTRLWPNRSALGHTALSAPLVLVICGLIFTICGIQLTPDYVTLISAPLALELPLFLNIGGLSYLGVDELVLKTSWAHPFTRAGSTLMFLGWISLLPIPTFPGGRILISRMGMYEARSGSSQTMLLMVIVLFGFLFGAFSGWNIWMPVVLICAINLLIHGSDPTLPLILDDSKELGDKEHRKISLTLFLAFMFVLPAQIPFESVDDWDESIKIEFSESTIKMESLWANHTLVVSNPSLDEQEYNISFMGDSRSLFEVVEIDCIGSVYNNGCNGKISPKDDLFISFHIKWGIEALPTHDSLIWVINNQNYVSEIIPDVPVYPIGSWDFNGDLSDPSSCISLEHNYVIENLSFDDLTEGSRWKFVGENMVCIEGLSGDNMSWVSQRTFSFNGTNFSINQISPNVVVIPDEGVMLDSSHKLFSEVEIVTTKVDQDCNELGTPSPQLRPDEGDWIWDLSVKSTGIMPILGNNSMLFKSPASPLLICQNSWDSKIYNVIRGPSLSLTENENSSDLFWLGSVDFSRGFIEIENRMSIDLQLRIEFGGNGVDQWNVSNEITLMSGEINKVEAEPPNSGISYSWLELDDDEIVLHLVNHEV